MDSRCPLCASTSRTELDSIRFEDIWASLRETWAVGLPDTIAARHTPADKTTLFNCGECGLDYFAPAVPGDSEFYDVLSRAEGIYLRDRWEFGLVAALVSNGEEVVDFGAGGGYFLSQLKGRAGRTVGVDHNPKGVAQMARQGIEATDMDFQRFAEANRASFDVSCAFQIAEHLPDVTPLINAATSVLRNGGRFFLSVPNRDRIRPDELEPLDCPPHHMSRWSATQLRALADRFDLRLVSVQLEPPDFSNAVQIFFERADRVCTPIFRKPRSWASRAYRKAFMDPKGYERAVRRQWFQKRGLFGHTMLAEFQPVRADAS